MFKTETFFIIGIKLTIKLCDISSFVTLYIMISAKKKKKT